MENLARLKHSDDTAVLHVFRPHLQIICGKMLVR